MGDAHEVLVKFWDSSRRPNVVEHLLVPSCPAGMELLPGLS